MASLQPGLNYVHDSPVESLDLCSAFRGNKQAILTLGPADLQYPAWDNRRITLRFIDMTAECNFVGRNDKETIDAIRPGIDSWHCDKAKEFVGGDPVSLTIVFHSGSYARIVCGKLVVEVGERIPTSM